MGDRGASSAFSAGVVNKTGSGLLWITLSAPRSWSGVYGTLFGIHARSTTWFQWIGPCSRTRPASRRTGIASWILAANLLRPGHRFPLCAAPWLAGRIRLGWHQILKEGEPGHGPGPRGCRVQFSARRHGRARTSPRGRPVGAGELEPMAHLELKRREETTQEPGAGLRSRSPLKPREEGDPGRLGPFTRRCSRDVSRQLGLAADRVNGLASGPSRNPWTSQVWCLSWTRPLKPDVGEGSACGVCQIELTRDGDSTVPGPVRAGGRDRALWT